MPHRLVMAAALALLLPFAATPDDPPTSAAKFNVRCPAPRACKKLEKDRLTCEAGKPCDPFLAEMKRLLSKYDCKRPVDTRPVPAIWLCKDVRDHATGNDGFDDALDTLSQLSSRPALELLASPALRKALDGGLAEVYMELSDEAKRLLVVGEDRKVNPFTDGVELRDGATVVQAKVGPRTAEVTVVGETKPAQEVYGTDLEPGQVPKAVRVVKDLRIVVNGKKVFVPRSSFLDLAWVDRANIVQRGMRWVLIISGGDASESYFVEIEFDKSTVRKRIMFGGEADTEPLEVTTFYQVTFE